ncbi:hypothetical protein [Pedobacter faecalis]|uniref:hypothetical protein n=1 Tax=Pedobacter faecalis TaxID=3041495 RepID=UPI00254BD0EA|nr:hypothetical protein [Pedobacter sp. ELA7]
MKKIVVSEAGTASNANLLSYAHSLAEPLSAKVEVRDNLAENGRSDVMLTVVGPDTVLDTPYLVVPDGFKYRPVRRIALAVDFLSADIHAVQSAASFARRFNADLVIVYITGDEREAVKSRKHGADFLNEVTCKINYDRIYFRQVSAVSVAQGLDWYSEFGLVDILIMTHRSNNGSASVGEGFCRALAPLTNIPLLVLPEGVYPVF